MVDIELLKNWALRPGPTGRYLERAANGEPFFFQADTAWELCHRLSREEVTEYLDARKAKGFNAVLTVLLPELDAKPLSGDVFGPDGRHSANADNTLGTKVFYPSRRGDVPLIDDDPEKPNESYFTHVDWVVEQALARGIVPFLVPTWARYLNGGWAGGPIIFNEQSARSYGAFIGQRYPYLPKLLGGDSNPVWTHAPQIWKGLRANGRKPHDEPLPRSDDLPRLDFHDVVNAMAEGILSTERKAWADDLGAPLLTYHPTAVWLPWSPSALASSFFGDQSWLTLDGCQTGHADFPNIPYEPAFHFWNARASHDPLTRMYNAKQVRPILDLESHYEGMHNGLNAANPKVWDGDDIRAGAWQSVLSGACGVVYGTNAVWQMYDKDQAKVSKHYKAVCGLGDDASWRTDLSLPGPGFLSILSSFMSSLPQSIYHKLQPAQSVLLESTAPIDVQELDGRIDVMRDVYDTQGSSTTLLAHSGHGYAFTLDLQSAFGIGARLIAAWFNPRVGERAPGWQVDPAVIAFHPPSSGSAKDDWVLIVQREKE